MHGYYCTGPVMEIYVGDMFSCDKNSKGQTSLRRAYIFYGIKSSYPERGSPETDSPLESPHCPCLQSTYTVCGQWGVRVFTSKFLYNQF